MWSAQAVRELKIDTLNAIFTPCAEPESRNSAVGWHWNTHTHTHTHTHIFQIYNQYSSNELRFLPRDGMEVNL